MDVSLSELWELVMDREASVQFSLSVVSDSATPWTAACQGSLYITDSQSLLKLMSIERVMTSNHLILCHPLLLLPSIFPSIRVFSNESLLHITWPEYWSFSFNISPSNEHQDCFSLEWTGWISLQSRGLSRPERFSERGWPPVRLSGYQPEPGPGDHRRGQPPILSSRVTSNTCPRLLGL